ncbi:putative Glutathione S-transferase 1 [Hypsibius exemplaris]|uniref:glutathione transferase n=1 Tax=Hypsibius exemplaris TaxID=2072580 RepID=A0A1W0X5B2_HYPEX|nr:putative Glutathione S-transferase 1 [Hypsibius exemplaris]
MSNPSYKLTYFNFRALAETTRFIFAYVKVPYEDVRIPMEQWPGIKRETPFRQLPVLEIDGTVYGQSAAFNRLLAKRFNLAGTTEDEQAHVDAIYDYGKDIWAANMKYWVEKDPVKKAQIQEEYLANELEDHLEVLQAHLTSYGKGKYFAPSGVTFADFWIANLLYSIEERLPTALDQHPVLKEYVQRIHNLPGIREWVATRPQI